MELTQLAPLFKCPACGRIGAELTAKELRCECGKAYDLCGKSVQVTADVSMSDAWKQKQVEGEGRYRDPGYHADDTVDRLFGGFIAVSLQRDSLVLDVGCGIRETPPPYISELGLKGYLGLEPLAQSTNRTYACLAGAVVERIPLADRSVNAVVFCTSLDHIEHVGPAYEEVRRVLVPGGRVYYWVSVYDPELLAKMQSYHHIFYQSSLPKRIARFAMLHGVIARYGAIMLSRKFKLWRGIPLDEKHFRYYTRASLRAETEQCGLVIDRELVVPGSNAVFLDARFAT